MGAMSLDPAAVSLQLQLSLNVPGGIMPARSHSSGPPPGSPPPLQLRVFRGDDRADERWIINPALPQPEAPARPLQQQLFANLAAEHESGPRSLTPAEVKRCREELTLPECYSEFMAPWRQQQIDADKVSAATVSKERTILRAWEEFDLQARPDDWPLGVEWRGCPVGYLAGGYLDRWLEFYAAKDSISSGSLKSAWFHLRTVLNWFRKVGILDRVPAPQPITIDAPEPDAADFDDDLATIYSTDELNQLYQALAGAVDLQAALVLAVCCGARAGDLFQTTWDKHLRLDDPVPMMRYVAEKTHKRHRVPLPPVAVAHLRRLQRSQLFEAGGLVFPRLVKSRREHKDPENSAAARRRNKRLRDTAAATGLPAHAKPWQVCRATCCSRFNGVRPGVGSWIIGQGTARAGTKLAADHYDNPTEEIAAAIQAASWPENWLKIL